MCVCVCAHRMCIVNQVIVYDVENDILELQMHRLDPLTPSNPTPFTYIPNQSPYVRKGSSVKLGRQFRNEAAKIIPSPGSAFWNDA